MRHFRVILSLRRTVAAVRERGSSDVGTNFPGTEVEPWVALNPRNPDDMLAVWQQDRWSNFGANGLGAAYTLNGGTCQARSAIARASAVST